MFDLVLTGGIVVDGTRSAPRPADVCIQNQTIVEVADRFEGESRQILDVTGKIVAPGFIDIHTHSDVCSLLPPPYHAESKLFQGVTTEITGNCGLSIVPASQERRAEIQRYFACSTELNLDGLACDFESVSDYAKQVNPNGCSHNYGLLVGHGALRGCVMGFDDRDPTPAELEELKAVLDRELSRGAFGMSLGLIYPPSAFCKLEELVALAEVVKQHNAILTVHMRNEGPRLFEAVDEMIEVTERSGVHLQISHLKLMGKPQWGRADELLQKIENARARGLDITCDQYPYNATSTGLAALTPKWAQDGGIDRLLERLGSHDRRLLDAILLEMGNRGGPDCVLVSSTHGHMPEAEGKRIDQISDLLHLSPEETVAEILIRSQGGVEAIYFSLDEKDIIEILRDMRIAIGSDGTSFCYDPHVTTTAPHPRSFGTFPRFLRMNRELRLMPIQDAVYKLTGLPASILGLPNRGVLRAGAAADITVFDEKTVTDCSDFLHPVVKPQGIECVLVAGEPTVLHNRSTEAHAGRILLRGQ